MKVTEYTKRVQEALDEGTQEAFDVLLKDLKAEHNRESELVRQNWAELAKFTIASRLNIAGMGDIARCIWIHGPTEFRIRVRDGWIVSLGELKTIADIFKTQAVRMSIEYATGPSIDPSDDADIEGGYELEIEVLSCGVPFHSV